MSETSAPIVHLPRRAGGGVVTVREFARALRISTSAAYRALNRGEVRAIRIGGAWRVPAAEVRRLLDGDDDHPP